MSALADVEAVTLQLEVELVELVGADVERVRAGSVFVSEPAGDRFTVFWIEQPDTWRRAVVTGAQLRGAIAAAERG